MMEKKDIIYLISAYSHPDPAVREERAALATKVALMMIQQGHCVFSPIAYSHQWADQIGADFGPWKEFDYTMLSHCDRAAVLVMDGIDQSKGAAEEIRFARENGIDLFYVRLVDGKIWYQWGINPDYRWSISAPPAVKGDWD